MTSGFRYSMVDMLSCAFIGAIFMFLLVLASGSPSPSASAFGTAGSLIVEMTVTDPDTLPVLVVTYPGKDGRTAPRYWIRPDRMRGMGLRRFAIPSEDGPIFSVLGSSPWTDTPEARTSQTLISIDPRASSGCWQFRVLFADTRGRLTTVEQTRGLMHGSLRVIREGRESARKYFDLNGPGAETGPSPLIQMAYPQPAPNCI